MSLPIPIHLVTPARDKNFFASSEVTFEKNYLIFSLLRECSSSFDRLSRDCYDKRKIKLNFLLFKINK